MATIVNYKLLFVGIWYGVPIQVIVQRVLTAKKIFKAGRREVIFGALFENNCPFSFSSSRSCGFGPLKMQGNCIWTTQMRLSSN